MKEKLIKSISAILFLLLVFGFAAANLFTSDKGFSESENRFLAQKPAFSWQALFDGKFTVAVEDYITDQFVGRDSFIGVKTQSEQLAGKQDTNNVYFGKDGYLLERFDNSNVDKELLQKNLDRIAAFVNTQTKALGNGQGSVVTMLVPTSAAVLTEKLPGFAPTFDQLATFEAFYSQLPSNSYVDVTPVLKEHQDEYIYYKTDHHWTTNGAYYAYRAYCDKIGAEGRMREQFYVSIATTAFYGTIYSKAQLSSTKPDTIYLYQPKQSARYAVDYNLGEKQTNTLYETDYLNKRDQYSVFLGGNNAVVKIQSQNKNGKHLLLIKDSFAHSIAPFLANDYETVHMIDLRYYNGSVSDYITENSITDILVLYNFSSLQSDTTILKIDK